MLAGAALGYAVGSISFSRIIGERAAPGQDLGVTRIDVPEMGTTLEFRGFTPTSVKEHAGTRAMAISMVLEIAKATAPTLVARRALPGTPAAPAAALGALVGHILPVWSGFRGGYGMTPMIGGLLVLDPVGLAVTTGTLSGVIGLTHRAQLMLVWPVTVPVWGALRGRRDLVAYGLAANVAYWGRLVPELRRGMAGLVTTRSSRGSRGLDVAPSQGGSATEGGQQAEEHQHQR
jgi:glycerol-3-phosphate acyltransferase PlsY